MRRFLSVSVLFLASLAVVQADPVLVLPFYNASSSAGLDWIGESIAQTVHDALSAQGALVLGREDRQEAYHRLALRTGARLTTASMLKLAESVDATDVVCGQFDFTPAAAGSPAGSRGTLHMSAWVLNMPKLRKGPVFLESGQLDDLAALQSHLAWQVLNAIAPQSTPPSEVFLKELPAVRLDAMENYTRGLLAANPEQKHRYFTQAARLDERFPQPNFELGRLYWAQKEYRLAAEWFSKLKPGTARYQEANFLLGLCRLYLGDYASAQSAFARVADVVPLNEVYNNLGVAQSRRNLPQAAESFRKALEGDPADPDYQFNVGLALWKQGDFTAAAESFRAALNRNPDDPQATTLLGRCLKHDGPHPADLKAGLERVKLNYEEGAWRQLKAALAGKAEAEQ